LQTNQDLILTTHVGSLPRTDAVVELLERRESGSELDEAAHTIVQRSVADIVSRQVEIGIDVVSDGETTKMSYATYVKDRLTGFSEEGPTKAATPHLDVAPFPDFQRKMELLTGARRFKRVSCVGPVAVRDRTALQRDLVNMKLATARAQPIDAFLNAASPGVVASFLPNQYYTSHEAYVEAVASAMSEEYRAIVTAGFVIQIDCPDLAMSRHTAFQDLTEAEFLKRAQFHVEALNHALAGIPSDKVRIHVCWGNYEGPHTHDIDLAKILKTILALNAQGLSLEAANPRHEHEWTIHKAAGRQGLAARRHRYFDQLRRASRSGCTKDRSLCRAGRARACHCQHRLRLRYVGWLRQNRSGDCLPQAGCAGGRRCARQQALVVIVSCSKARG
jgi:5-methyltetrahydropteroyltriglutamate--homocysteine methyltransferase